MLKQLFENVPKSKVIGFILILIVVVTITYSNHFQNSFHFDDSHTIENNLYIQNIKNIPLFFKDATTFSSLPSNQSYRPIVSTSLTIDYWLGGGFDMFYFHLDTFLLFLLQGIIMFFLFYKILELSYKNEWNIYISAIATLWYMLHPANAETVNYIISRSDIQSTLGVIVGLLMYQYSSISKKWNLFLIPVVIGILAKPSAVMFAPILFFYILLFEQDISLSQALKFKTYGKQLWKVFISVAPTFIVCGLMFLLVDHLTPKTWQSGGFSKFNYLITQPFVITHYFTTFFLPFGLSADTDWQTLQTIWDSRFFAGMLFIIIMIIIAFWFSKDKRLRPISFGIIWFFLALIPSSSIIPFAEVLNDHRIYFPYVGLAISACWTVGLLLLKAKKTSTLPAKNYAIIVSASVLILLTAYSYGTYQRNKVWETEETLWHDVTIKSPKNGRGLMNYGLSKMSRGDYVTAEKYFLDALKLWPYYSSLHVNMGVLKNAKGDAATAEMYFKNAVNYSPGYPDSWFFYGKFLCDKNRYSEAIPALEKSIELSSAHIGARNELMKAYFYTNNSTKLIQLAQNTLQLLPNNPEALNYLEKAKQIATTVISEEDARKSPSVEKYLQLGLQYYQNKNYEKCIEASLEALKLNANSHEAYNNIGSSYNMLQHYDKAIIACKKALEINPNFEIAKNNLLLALNSADNKTNPVANINNISTAENYLDQSLIFYNQGLYEKSIEACKTAIQLKPDYADAHSNMGAAYNQLKQWDKAIEAFNKALRINPQHKLALGNLNWAKQEKVKTN